MNIKPANKAVAEQINKELKIADPPKHSKAMDNLFSSGVFNDRRTTEDDPEGN